MAHRTVILDGHSLTIADLVAVARKGAHAALAPAARKRMERSRAWVEKAVERQAVVYGITTGFGAFQNVSIGPGELRDLQRNLILSHCAGTGEPFPAEAVRGMMVLRANALARGHSGIRVATVERLLAMLNKGVHPVVPQQGSVGASGDLAPLSHIAAVLIGEGEAEFRGVRMPGRDALEAAGLKPVTLEAKEGLALNNGTQAMTAVAALAAHDAEVLAETADTAAAMTLEAVKGKSAPFDVRVGRVRPHNGQSQSAARVRAMIKGSMLVDAKDDDTRDRVQDSYSLRCVPQVHGASRDALRHVRMVLEIEMNSATDNPLVFPERDTALSAGNFHGQPVALAADFLALAAAELGNIAERRVAKLMDLHHNGGLPAFLAGNGGVESGLMIAQYTAAALVSENKVLVHPASADSIPTSANQEDHVSMGTIAARQARDVAANVARVLAIELLCAARALDFRQAKAGRGTEAARRLVLRAVGRTGGDRALTHDIEDLTALVRAGAFAAPVRQH